MEVGAFVFGVYLWFTMQKLPIDPFIPEVLASLEQTNCLVLQAEPGTGKTTRVPPALLTAKFRGSLREILVLEPRRLAAKMAATWVAHEQGEKVGQTIGYQFRFERVASAETRVLFLTEGMLMRRLLGDPELKNVAAVILDEFHERHLHGDIALAYLRRLQLSTRKDLRLIVMSATIDTASVAGFLGNCKVLQVPGARFPITIEYANQARDLETQVRDALQDLLTRQDADDFGDVLVFLPGMGEIRRVADALTQLSVREKFQVLPLHGELSREEQDRVVGKSAQRKVILSTNVAETSLTIPGVNTVIDSGLARVSSHSWWSGLPALKTKSISKASAIQRAGRSGRTSPGRCVRLYSKGDFDGRTPFEIPEVSRADLCQSVLELKSLGVKVVSDFQWFEAPKENSLKAAQELLFRLGAVDEQGELAAIGKSLVEFPLHPRLGRLVVEAQAQGFPKEGARLAALLSEGRFATVDLLKEFEEYRPDENARKLISRIEDRRGPISKVATRSQDAALRFSILAAFPDRVARKRHLSDIARSSGNNKSVELVLSGGGAAYAEDTPFLRSSEFFVTTGIEEKQHLDQARSQLKVSSLCPIEADWLLDLKPSGVTESEEAVWDDNRQRVIQNSKMSYGQLVLSEDRGNAQSSDIVSHILSSHVVVKPEDREKIHALRRRIELLRKHEPAGEFPDLDDSWTAGALKEFCGGKTSLAEVEGEDFLGFITGQIASELSQKIARHTPETVTLARGRKVSVNYEDTQAPWIESRIQDFFGLKDGPTILNGRVPLTLHLLAPNRRAVQVTADLAGFWKRHYPEIRRELGRRYPRHSWPEDPLALYVDKTK